MISGPVPSQGRPAWSSAPDRSSLKLKEPQTAVDHEQRDPDDSGQPPEAIEPVPPRAAAAPADREQRPGSDDRWTNNRDEVDQNSQPPGRFGASSSQTPWASTHRPHHRQDADREQAQREHHRASETRHEAGLPRQATERRPWAPESQSQQRWRRRHHPGDQPREGDSPKRHRLNRRSVWINRDAVPVSGRTSPKGGPGDSPSGSGGGSPDLFRPPCGLAMGPGDSVFSDQSESAETSWPNATARANRQPSGQILQASARLS